MSMYVGYHFQNAVRDWPVTFELQPAGTHNKFFQVQLLAEAKSKNPGTKGILRYWDDVNQKFDGGDYRQAARDFFKRFVDGTFDNYAHLVDYIEGWNEYLANSQTQAEIAERVKWVDALTLVWQNEYRTQPKYSHIRLIVANAAIGNDIPIEIARIAYARDAVLGYHPYMPVRNGVPYTYKTQSSAPEYFTQPPAQSAKMVPGEDFPVLIPNQRVESLSSSMDDGRRFFWLRWQAMDEWYRSEGIFVDWMFTEFGPLNYTEYPWGLALDGGGGWRHPNVCNGSVVKYLDSIGLFMDEVADWNSKFNNRALGCVLFTTNATTNGVWGLFETAQPEMSNINTFLANYTPISPPVDPTPPPSGGTVLDEILNFGLGIVDANNDSALQLAIWEDGWDIGGPEKWLTASDGAQYAVKPAVSPDSLSEIRVYYAKVPIWNDVKWVSTKK